LEKGLDLLTPQENADLIWLALKNSGRIPSHAIYGNGINPVLPDYIVAGRGYFATDLQVDPSLYNYDNSNGQPIYHIVPFNKAGTDWFHELFQPALSQNHTLTVSGGNDKNKYLFSAGYLDQQGTLLNTFLKRYTTRINTEFTVLNTIRMGENLQLAYSKNHGAVNNFQNNIADMLLYYPFLPLYDIMGNWSTYSVPDLGPMENPVAARILSKDNVNNQWQILGNVYAEVDFLKHFKARTSFGGTLNHYYNNRFAYFTYVLTASGAPNNYFEERSGYFRSWTWTNTLIYDAIFRNHQIKALVGMEEKSNYNREHGGSRVGYIVSDPAYRFLSNGRPPDNPNYSFAGTSYLTSFISQMNYGFKEKYLVSGSLRRDGSSIFGPENRFGWFPSLGVAWRITEEEFINKWDWLKEFKIRSSWGKTGFYGNTDPFNQYTLYGGGPGSAYYAIDGSSNSAQLGLRTVRIGNAKTGWQEDVVLTIGFESVFWGGKLSITADRYVKKSKGLLFPASLPALLGNATPPNVNIGNVKNTGIDVLAASKGNFTKNWQWDVTATFTAYKSKIVKLNEVPYFFTFPTGEGPLVKNEAGYPFGSFYGYKIIGLFQDTDDINRSPTQQAAAPGRFKYADVTGRDTAGNLTGIPDGQITPDDRVHFGNPNPDFTLGLNIGLSFKNFDFTAFFYGSFGNDIYNGFRFKTDIFKPFFTPKSKTALYNSWAPDRRNAKAPVIEDDYNFSNAGVVHSYSLEKGTYFRNKTMTLGYQLPQRWLQKIKMERCRVYLQVVNLFTLTKYSGLDPELPGSSEAFGIDYYGNYPNNQKQFLVGINAGF
jgi:TonB-linked SusC/RagA family outer membrane protein